MARMSLEVKDATYYSLKFLKICGLHPDSKSVFLTIYFVINLAIVITILTLALIGLLTTYKTNIFRAIENLQTVFLYIHILGKYPTLFLDKNTLSHLLKEKSKFWKLDDFNDDIREECVKILKRTTTFVRYFIVITTLVVLNFFLQPFLTGELPVIVYVPKGCFYIIYGVFWYLIPCIVGSIYGSDVIFCSICIPAMIQFKLLAHKFEFWDLTSKKERLKEMIDHQNFLIGYCHQINKYTNIIFFMQVFTSTAIVCMQLFIASQKEFLLSNKLKCLAYCIMEIIETGIYCFNAELISEASVNVGNAAYKSKWYQTSDNGIKKSISLVIAKSQNPILFSGGGLIWINLKTFTQMFKTALSFYSYLNTMVSFEGN